MRFQKAELAGVLAPPSARIKAPRSAAPSRRSECGRALARENELRLMKTVMQFGHARLAELARAVWPANQYGIQMANRTAKRLVQQGLLFPRRNSLGGTSLCISRPGAVWLDARGISARDTLSLSSIAGPSFFHRTLATRYLIERQVIGDSVAGEYAIFRGQLPFSIDGLASSLRKMPDGLVWRDHPGGYHSEKVRRVEWVEQEAAMKARPEIERCLRAAEHVSTRLSDDGRTVLVGMVFVFDDALSHARRILHAADSLWGHKSATERALLERRVKLVCVKLRPPLTWISHSDTTLHEYRQRQSV